MRYICRRPSSIHVLERYAGTRLGRQELDGEIVEDRPDALWSRALIEPCRVAEAPPLERIVVAVDPPASAARRADACGIVAAGRAENGVIYVIADETVAGLSPAGWAARAIALWRSLPPMRWSSKSTRAATWCAQVIGEADPTVPVTRCAQRAASGCAPSRSRRSTSRAG